MYGGGTTDFKSRAIEISDGLSADLPPAPSRLITRSFPTAAAVHLPNPFGVQKHDRRSALPVSVRAAPEPL